MKTTAFLLLLSFLAGFPVSAVEFTIVPQAPWTGENGSWSIQLDGSESRPMLRILPGELRKKSYYKLSFDAELRNLPLTVCCQRKNGNGVSAAQHQKTLRESAGQQRFSFYFRTGNEKTAVFALYSNPGETGRARISGIRLEEVSELGNNLLTEGDFESGNVLLPRHKKFEKQLSIVESPAFLSGEKSLLLKKKANDFAAAITGDLPALPGKTAVIRFWARSETGTVPGMLYLDFFRNGHKKHLYRRFLFRAEEEWKEFTFSWTISSDTTVYTALTEGMARLQFHLLKSAEENGVYFDNLEYFLE